MASRCVDQNSRTGGAEKRGLRPPALPDEVSVKRSDPIYNAHAYLTKVPVSAIEPFLRAFTSPGDVVLDMYGGSGMTAVAAAMLGRRAEIRDISALGRHIGKNYLNLVDPSALGAAAEDVIRSAETQLGNVYGVSCGGCGDVATLSRTVWSYVYECGECKAPVNYYESLRAADWKKAEMSCGTCGTHFVTRGARRIDEEPMADTVACACSPKLLDFKHREPISDLPATVPSGPSVPIGEDRQMFQASALRKHGLLTTDAFFSRRNFAALSAIRDAIGAVEDDQIRSKLLFSFTGILTRASKRYQWHPKRPLNAANHNYYIAPVFYEWNVYDLFKRKIKAAIRSDEYIRTRMKAQGLSKLPECNYKIRSADALDLSDESVDYVFTDPPFGSNIFYSDMNLFQEVWLGTVTQHEREAVVDRSKGGNSRDAKRYERLITDSLKEASRVLRTDGWLSIVFSNSNGAIWALLQRAIGKAGFDLSEVTLLSKGQRSVKGLASGFENVVTADLVLSMKKQKVDSVHQLPTAPRESLQTIIDELLGGDRTPTPSHLYLEIVRRYLRRNWDLTGLHIGDVISSLERAQYKVDIASGLLVQAETQAAKAFALRR
jgi:DNA modification methylase